MRELAFALLAACGGSDVIGGDEDLTCEIIASPTNCWAKAAASAFALLPTTPMTLSADRTTCTAGGQTAITFSAPLATQTTGQFGFAFTATGWSFDDTGHNDILLTVGGDTTELKLVVGDYSMTCADGTAYHAAFSDVIECPRAPTDGFSTDGDIEFTLVAPNVPTPTFTCSE